VKVTTHVTGDVEETLIEFNDNSKLLDLCGSYDQHIVAIEEGCDVTILRRGNIMAIHGTREARAHAQRVLQDLHTRLDDGLKIDLLVISTALKMQNGGAVSKLSVQPSSQLPASQKNGVSSRLEIRTPRKVIEPRNLAQRDYIKALQSRELVFGVGPAGTGKTYLAVAVAVEMFEARQVKKIILSRPAVEAGERLGFLPGDMKEKIDPYLRPLYDALHDMMPAAKLERYMADGCIEVAPLAFMRGRTLSDAFIVLDEAQNTTNMQMKMFLTRLGEGSRMAINGDPSQIDLPTGVVSGMKEAIRVLRDVEDIGFSRFTVQDVVRHHLVAKIIGAYDRYRNSTPP
jgi:phosphate starvation-inducible protein PhoH and related proteins